MSSVRPFFTGLLHEDLLSMTKRELDKTKVELFQSRLHFESEQGRMTTLIARQARLEQDLAKLQGV